MSLIVCCFLLVCGISIVVCVAEAMVILQSTVRSIKTYLEL